MSKKLYVARYIKSENEKMGPAKHMESLYFDGDVKLLAERKDLPFFINLGANMEIKDIKNYKQATGLRTYWFSDKGKIIEILGEKGHEELFKSKGGVIDVSELKQADVNQETEHAKRGPKPKQAVAEA